MLTLNDGRNELWQWDTGRKLAVDADCTQVHFSNKFFGRSVDVDVVDCTAEIPDVLLQVDKELLVWAFVGTAENGYTKISKVFKVNKRNKPADYVFTPPEQTTLAGLIARLDAIEESQDPDAIKNAVEDYLEQNPVEAPVESVNGKTGEVKLTAEDVGAISQDDLREATNEALAQAKASGAFDGKDGKDGEPGKDGQPGAAGKDGYTPVKGVDYFDGKDGKDYILTEADKQEIAEKAAELVDVPEPDLSGLVKSVNGIAPDEKGNVEIAVSGGGGKEWTKVREEFLYKGGESGNSGRYPLAPKISISADFTEAFVMAMVTNNTSNTGHRINYASDLTSYITGSTMTPKGAFLLAYHAVRFENRIVISSLDSKGTHTSIEIAKIATGYINLHLHWATIAAGESISSVGEVMYR